MLYFKSINSDVNYFVDFDNVGALSRDPSKVSLRLIAFYIKLIHNIILV